MRTVDKIIIHCTATPEGRIVTVADVDKWHKERGWSGIGYHYLIGLKGEIWKGRPEWKIGAHTVGENAKSIGIAYAGGMTKDMKKAKDTRTPEQKAALLKLINDLKSRYHDAKVYGHRDFAKKDCPSFDAKNEYRNV